jgi:hypothetical protein
MQRAAATDQGSSANNVLFYTVMTLLTTVIVYAMTVLLIRG